MSTADVEHDPLRSIPLRLWVAIALLGIEGLANLLAIPDMPVAAYWLVAKILFIVGFIKGWRLVYVLFLVVAALHVVGFASTVPVASLLNLILIVLVGSAYRHFFPPLGARPTVAAS